jgi:hypothetical protein
VFAAGLFRLSSALLRFLLTAAPLALDPAGELLCGPDGEGLGPGRSVFPSEEARRAAWFSHRDEILADCNALARPSAWWRYRSGTREPNPLQGERQAETLERLGLLRPDASEFREDRRFGAPEGRHIR